MRQLLALAVQRVPGVSVDEAGDGVAALKKIKMAAAQPYSLVFLDLNMPVLDGMKLLGKLRDEPSAAQTAVVVVTTTESSEAELRCRALGARFFMRKPVNRRAVDKILAEVFGLTGP